MAERPWQAGIEELAAQLGVDPQVGLSADEAARRLRRDGPNQLRGAPEVPAWRRLLAQFDDFGGQLLLSGAVNFICRDIHLALNIGIHFRAELGRQLAFDFCLAALPATAKDLSLGGIDQKQGTSNARHDH